MFRNDYLADIYKLKATERFIQELVEAAIDINTHIIASTAHMVPDYYYESFIKLGKIGVLPPDLASLLVLSSGLRNQGVHEYDGLDHGIVLNAVRMAGEQYPGYADGLRGVSKNAIIRWRLRIAGKIRFVPWRSQNDDRPHSALLGLHAVVLTF